MNKVTVEYVNGFGDTEVEEWGDIIAHQIGSAMIQLVFSNGVQRIINNFTTIDIVPDEETQNKWTEQSKEASSSGEKKKKTQLEVVKD
jgi:hypothetical protein